VADLRGKRISLDEPGSGTLVDARIILEAYGLSEDDLKPEYVKPDIAVEKIKTIFSTASLSLPVSRQNLSMILPTPSVRN
jgi:TRAP-type uncharacterized transport system substrate-binding protein